MIGSASQGQGLDLERILGRLVSSGTLVAVLLLAIGVLVMLAAGHSPIDPTRPAFSPAGLLPDLLAGRPEGFLGAGLAIALATPVARVAGALVGSLARRDTALALIAAGVLVVMAAGVVVGMVGG